MSPVLCPVILPSENQTREFDAKLLLACVLADKGVSVYVGARHQIHNNIHKFPASLYLAKDFRKPSCRIFTIMEQLGHHIAAWDEEGMLFPSDEIYYKRRIAEPAFSMVREFYAWGEVNEKLLRNAPNYSGAPIHRTGNPRLDLLRPELRHFFDGDVRDLKERFGDFILINSNFGVVNHFVPSQQKKGYKAGMVSDSGSHGVMDEIWQYRNKMFQEFLELVPRLSNEFPNNNIIVRPHPSENHEVWRKAALGLKQVHILHEGNVIPWLLAAKAMIHNGCSTGVESFLLDRQSISYQPFQSSASGPILPNILSHSVSAKDELVNTLKKRLYSTKPIRRDETQLHSVDNFADARLGDCASDRISVHVLKLLHSIRKLPSPSTGDRFIGNTRSRWRNYNKRIGHYIPGSKTGKNHNLHRFPPISDMDVTWKIKKFTACLNRFENLTVKQVGKDIFLICKENLNKID